MTTPNARRLSHVTAAVLAGGLGTRLRPALDDRPKVLAPVSGRPFVTYLLDQLDAAGVRRVVLLTGYRGGQVRQALGERRAGISLVYSDEPSPQGTGGALREALGKIDTETFLLLNGDSYCGLDLVALTAFHRTRRADLSLALTRVDDAGRYGVVETGEGERVARFAEKQQTGEPGWINAGVYLVQRRLVEEVPAGRAVSLERELLPAWLTNKAVFGYRARGPFLDVGTPESYASSAKFFEELSAGREGRQLLGMGSP